MTDIEILQQQVEKSLQEAATNALQTKRWLGQYAVIVENGKPIQMAPEDIGVLLKKQRAGLTTNATH
ncbi:MAG TPA: hypothetical protein PLY87_09975 [Planctomycetaceae bacterium]|nr:hypothetical protein [Planctomycetaceae bacterium]HQZ65394.1 hypothetical protein [Planctomycetaceae bacterium]HRA89462.1 hypothetical protein [Planctomycetaceae bacterium]